MQIQHRHNVIYHSWSGDTIKSTKQMYLNNPWNSNIIITIRDHCIIILEYGNTKKLAKNVQVFDQSKNWRQLRRTWVFNNLVCSQSMNTGRYKLANLPSATSGEYHKRMNRKVLKRLKIILQYPLYFHSISNTHAVVLLNPTAAMVTQITSVCTDCLDYPLCYSKNHEQVQNY